MRRLEPNDSPLRRVPRRKLCGAQQNKTLHEKRRLIMATLYEIDQAILDCIDTETGEILDMDRLNELQIQREKKVEGVACYIKNLVADAAAYKAEKEAFAERERIASRKAERLKEWLVLALEGQKFSSPKCAVSFRRSETVEVEDVKHIPAELLRVKTTVEPDKTAIKTMLKAGQEIEGCRLVEKLNTQVK